MKRLRVGAMISGRGSNLAALLEACGEPDYPAEIVTVLSNQPDAPGLDIAREAGVPTRSIDHRAAGSREAFDAAATAAMEEAGVELVCLAGFMRLLTEGFVDRWRDRLINIHPSLLPAFPGLDTHDRAIKAGVRIAGCTVHFVRFEMDTGPIIAQAAVPVAGDDTAATLAARVLAVEHRLYPMALGLVASGRARVVGDRVFVGGEDAPPPALLVPSEA